MTAEASYNPDEKNTVHIKVKLDTTEAEKAIHHISEQLDLLLEKENRLLTVLADTEKAIGSQED